MIMSNSLQSWKWSTQFKFKTYWDWSPRSVRNYWLWISSIYLQSRYKICAIFDTSHQFYQDGSALFSDVKILFYPNIMAMNLISLSYGSNYIVLSSGDQSSFVLPNILYKCVQCYIWERKRDRYILFCNGNGYHHRNLNQKLEVKSWTRQYFTWC